MTSYNLPPNHRHPYTVPELESLLADAMRDEENDYGDQRRARGELAWLLARIATALDITHP